eukprot:538721-Amorphochlora_amoeboformis.AAC.1
MLEMTRSFPGETFRLGVRLIVSVVDFSSTRGDTVEASSCFVFWSTFLDLSGVLLRLLRLATMET